MMPHWPPSVCSSKTLGSLRQQLSHLPNTQRAWHSLARELMRMERHLSVHTWLSSSSKQDYRSAKTVEKNTFLRGMFSVEPLTIVQIHRSQTSPLMHIVSIRSIQRASFSRHLFCLVKVTSGTGRGHHLNGSVSFSSERWVEGVLSGQLDQTSSGSPWRCLVCLQWRQSAKGRDYSAFNHIRRSASSWFLYSWMNIAGTRERERKDVADQLQRIFCIERMWF